MSEVSVTKILSGDQGVMKWFYLGELKNINNLCKMSVQNM